jgi:CRP-like cAMP-binding protein
MLVKKLDNCTLRNEDACGMLRPSGTSVIERFRSFEASAGVDYKNSFVREEKKKGDILVHEGDSLTCLRYLESGMARQYSTQGHTEITSDFFFPSEFIDIYNCSVLGKPSQFSIEIISDAVLYSISKVRLSQLTTHYPELAEIEKMVVACYIGNMFNRISELQSLTAKERYQHFEKTHPYLFHLVPLHQIASYLGMKPETLSRIRK